MTDNSDSQQSQFEHFHVCIHCGSAFRREEFSGRAISSGIYTCPKCGLDGPLNIEIREVAALDESKNNTPDAGSSSQG